MSYYSSRRAFATPPPPGPLTRPCFVREVARSAPYLPRFSMDMLNPHCGVDRDPRGVVRLTICNAGSLNILGSAVTDGVREGFEKLAGDKDIRALILAGHSENSTIPAADITHLPNLAPKPASAFLTPFP